MWLIQELFFCARLPQWCSSSCVMPASFSSRTYLSLRLASRAQVLSFEFFGRLLLCSVASAVVPALRGFLCVRPRAVRASAEPTAHTKASPHRHRRLLRRNNEGLTQDRCPMTRFLARLCRVTKLHSVSSSTRRLAPRGPTNTRTSQTYPAPRRRRLAPRGPTNARNRRVASWTTTNTRLSLSESHLLSPLVRHNISR